MYGYKISDYVPMPKPVKTDYTIAALYYPGWSKPKADALHRGFDIMHDYPERTPILGYYDGASPELNDWEIKWALEHGINCFVHCWYRYKSNVGKPVTRDDLRLADSLHDGFFKAKYQSMMNFAIMFEACGRWGATDRRDMLDNLMPFWLENYFKRDNYLKVDNKPVLFIFDSNGQVRNSFDSIEGQRETFDKCREMAKQNGFDGMIFAIESRGCNKAVMDEHCLRGYDFFFSYCWQMDDSEYSHEDIMNAQINRMQFRVENFTDKFVPTASVMWDTSPWLDTGLSKKENSPLLWKLTPEEFKGLLQRIKEMMSNLPQNSIGSKMIMLDNWNEWGEGHYLFPNLEFGFAHLQAIREVLTHCDNLPDYRLPHELGTASVNSIWIEP